MSRRNQKKLAKQKNNASRKRVPPLKDTSAAKKVPGNATDSGSYRQNKVRWTAREIDSLPGTTSLRWSLKSEETIELLKFLDDVSHKTWAECETETTNGHKRNHYHEITSLSRAAQDRLRESFDGEEQIFRFRLSSKCRLWGFRSGDLFRVVWYDPEHEVYPVGKRNT